MTQFNRKDISNGLYSIAYKGIQCVKFPFDYVQYQMIVHEVRPDLIIEIGTMTGGSAVYFADLMALNGIKGEVHSIDLIVPEEQKSIRTPNVEVHPFVKDHPQIKLFTEGWQNYDLELTKGFKCILVIDDGSHIYEDVLGALLKFGPYVSPGSYYIVEDGNAEEICDAQSFAELGGGPLRAIFEYLKSCNPPLFHVDLNRCDMFGINSTYNTYGYLKRLGG